jgi:hypothetical protein
LEEAKKAAAPQNDNAGVSVTISSTKTSELEKLVEELKNQN